MTARSKGVDGAVGAGDHDAAFHDGEDVGCEGVGVGVSGEAGLELVDALADGSDPALEVFGDEFVGGTVFWVDLEGQAAEGAAVAAFCLEDAVAVAGEDAEDALEGLVGLGEGGVDDHGAQGVEVAGEDFAEKGFFALEEVVEAAGVDVGVGEQVGHAGSGESSLPEEVAGGVDETVSSRDGGGGGHFCLQKLLTESVYRDFTLNDQPTGLNERSREEGSMKSTAMRKRRIVLAVWLMVGCGVALRSAQGAERVGSSVVVDREANGAAGDRALVIEVTVPAPIGEVWKAFTTSAGLSTWLTPNAVVDCGRVGSGRRSFLVEARVGERF